MTANTVKKILFFTLIAAMVLPFSGMNYAEATPIDKKQDLKDEIREWIIDHDGMTFQAKSNELKIEYDEYFRSLIEEMRIGTDTQILNEYEIRAMINYMLIETLKDENNKYLETTPQVKLFGLDPYCETTTEPIFKELTFDVVGGTYGFYTFEGGNDMFDVQWVDNSSTCERTYTLYWLDEDHPYLDKLYDRYRLDDLGRLHDVESFVIINNTNITYVRDAWSNNNSYDCLDWGFGCHDNILESYPDNPTIYVSNTWNHMMGLIDTNPQMAKVTVS